MPHIITGYYFDSKSHYCLFAVKLMASHDCQFFTAADLILCPELYTDFSPADQERIKTIYDIEIAMANDSKEFTASEMKTAVS